MGGGPGQGSSPYSGRVSNEKNNSMPIENQIKVLFFMKTLETTDSRMIKNLKKKLENETYSFLLAN